jgi:hypothetical protein
MAGRNVVGLVLVVAVFFVASALAAPQWPLQWYLHLPQLTTHESKEKNENLNTHSFGPARNRQSEFNFVNVSSRVLLNYGSVPTSLTNPSYIYDGN